MNRAGMRPARGLAVGVLAVCAGLAGAVIPSAVGGAQVEPSQIQATANAIPGEYIVALRPTAKGDVPGFANSLAARYGGEVFFTYESAFTGFAIRTTPDRAEQLARNPHVESVAENGVAQVDTTEPAPPAPWGLDRIDEEYLPLDGSYNYVADGAGVMAYIIDTGIRVGHSEFGGRAVFGVDEIGGQPEGTDCNGHGTHVSGTVGGSTYGVAKAVTLVEVRVLDCNGSGSWAGVIAGIDWVTSDHLNVHKGPAVANMSLGGGKFQSVNNAVTNSIASGVVYSVAAGNDNSGNACLDSPASTPNAITVGATGGTGGYSDARPPFSNIGTCLDLFAPGVAIKSSWGTGDTATNTISGTSMATPHVTGVAALYLTQHPGASASSVRDQIVNNAIPDVVGNPGSGSPNLLLYSQFVDGIPPVTTTTTTTTTSTTTTTTTTTTKPAVLAPNAPGTLQASPKKTNVNLTWPAPIGGGAPTGYKVYRGTTSDPTKLTLVATLGNTTSYNSTGLQRHTSYYFQVSATNSAGESSRTPVAPLMATTG